VLDAPPRFPLLGGDSGEEQATTAPARRTNQPFIEGLLTIVLRGAHGRHRGGAIHRIAHPRLVRAPVSSILSFSRILDDVTGK
jgi:hypothetical protein